LEEGVEIADLN
jgi:hypothetical protein